MGTVLEVTLLGADAERLEAARNEVFAEVARVEALLSRWRPTSDVSRLNAAAGGAALEVDADVAALLARAARLSAETGGSFDVTVGPLVALWTEAAARDALPSAEALAEARTRVGPERMRFDAPTRVALAEGSAVDLGGLAKGYALDRARALLASGIEAALLNFGQSSTWALGRPPDAEGWTLLARSPEGGFAGLLTLRDQALSVVGQPGAVERDRRPPLRARARSPLGPSTDGPAAGPGRQLRRHPGRGALEGGPGAGRARWHRTGRPLARRRGAAARRRWAPLANDGLGRRHALRGGRRSPGLKRGLRASDPGFMQRDLTCPVCQADLPLAGDEQGGDEVFCTYCGAPCKVLRKSSDDEIEIEEDF